MSHLSHRYPFIAIAGLLLSTWCGSALAQSQGDSAPSVAEAARRAREQKKTSAKPVRTLTNDNLEPAPPAAANQAGASSAPAAAEETPDQPKGEAAAKPVDPDSDEKAEKKKADSADELRRLKKDLARSANELDVLQRKAALDSDSYYSQVDFASDKDGKAALDAQAQQIVDKQQAVAALKEKIAQLEAIVGEPAPPPAAPDKDN